MKRIGSLFDRIIDLDNLYKSANKARKNKTKKSDIISYFKDLDNNILEIYNELKDKTYKTSEYYVFKLYEPKERIISKLPFKDRIVHHAILNILEPIFTKCFICHTYSCIKRRGIHKCLKDVQSALKNDNLKYCLKLDIKKFYQNVDKEILKTKLRTKFKDNDLLWLLDEIINSHKERVPLGNYTSQFFANFYLNTFDHIMKEKFKLNYFRYADDIVILHNDKEFLKELLVYIEDYLNSELSLKLSKHRIFPVKLGIDFVGYKIFKNYTLLRKSIKLRFINMMKKYPNHKSIMSYYGWLKHANCKNLWNKYVNIKL